MNALVFDAMRKSESAVTGAGSPRRRTPYPFLQHHLPVFHHGDSDAWNVEFLADALDQRIDILRRTDGGGGQRQPREPSDRAVTAHRPLSWTGRAAAPPA